jgi:Ni/Co efflux regulator RcnB
MKRTLIALLAVAFAATAMPAFAQSGKSDEKKPAAEAKDKKGGEKAAEKSGEKAPKKEKKQREGC